MILPPLRGFQMNVVLATIVFTFASLAIAQEQETDEQIETIEDVEIVEPYKPVEYSAEPAKVEPGGPALELEGLNLKALVDGDDPVEATQETDSSKEEASKTETSSDSDNGEDLGSFSDRVSLGGYGQHEFFVGEGEKASFRNHRLVLFVSAQISKRISFASEIEWEFAGSPMKKDGVYRFGEVLIEYAVLDFMFTRWLNFRAGVILVPNAFNVNHDAPLRELTDRPMVITTVIPSTWFESGAGFFGDFKPTPKQRMGYEIYMVNGLDSRIYDGLGFRAARGSHFSDNNQNKAITGRIFWAPTMQLEFGVFGYTGEYDLADNRVNMVAVDLRARIKSWEFLGEVVYASVDPGYVEGFSSSSEANTRDAVPEGMWGFYGQINYHFQWDWLNSVLPEDLSESKFTFALRYGGIDTNTDIYSAIGDRRRLTLAANYRPVTRFVIKVNFQWNTRGADFQHGAPEFWNGAFWSGRKAGFLADRFITSIAWAF